MASSNSFHVRSNSLPSNPHPLITQVDDHLCRLRTPEQSSSSSSAVCRKLSGLQDLHDCIDKLLQLPLSQQDLLHESEEKSIAELQDGSLRLLDVCGTAKDALLQTKEDIHELQSVLRRRRGGKLEISSELRKCLTSRKIIKKSIHKALKGMEDKRADKTHETMSTTSMLREVEAVTANTLESLLSFIEGPKRQSKFSSWSLVSKLVQSKRVENVDHEETHRNELEMLDDVLNSISSYKTNKSGVTAQVENLQNFLGKVESSIQGLQQDVECLYRRLIRTRVSFLNIFNH